MAAGRSVSKTLPAHRRPSAAGSCWRPTRDWFQRSPSCESPAATWTDAVGEQRRSVPTSGRTTADSLQVVAEDDVAGLERASTRCVMTISRSAPWLKSGVAMPRVQTAREEGVLSEGSRDSELLQLRCTALTRASWTPVINTVHPRCTYATRLTASMQGTRRASAYDRSNRTGRPFMKMLVKSISIVFLLSALLGGANSSATGQHRCIGRQERFSSP